MASSYALPPPAPAGSYYPGAHAYTHGHSHSYSGTTHLAPSRESASHHTTSNGSAVKKAVAPYPKSTEKVGHVF